MGRLASGLTGLALTATLTACGSEAAPAPAPTSTKTASPAPSPSPSASIALTPPVMPEAAKAHTRAGAKAFVVYYWRVVDYAQNTLDTSPVAAISDPTCAACKAGIKSLRDIAVLGGRFVGGGETVSHVNAFPVRQGKPETVAFNLTNQRQQVVVPGKKTVVHSGRISRMLMALIPRDGGWLAADFEKRS